MSDPGVQPRSWWSRNGCWVVPVGCLGLLVVFAGFIALLGGVLMGGMKSTDAYREALARAQASPEVRAALGEPVKAGWFVQGNVNVSGPSGNADLSVPLSGPKGKGTLYITAKKQAGKWEYEVLEVAVDGRQERIKLLNGSPTSPTQD